MLILFLNNFHNKRKLKYLCNNNNKLCKDIIKINGKSNRDTHRRTINFLKRKKENINVEEENEREDEESLYFIIVMRWATCFYTSTSDISYRKILSFMTLLSIHFSDVHTSYIRYNFYVSFCTNMYEILGKVSNEKQ